MGIELKPCPFCGSDRVYYTETEEQNYTDHVEGFIWCHGCGFSSDVFLDPEIAAEAWNRRANEHRCAVYLPEKLSKNAELLDVLMKASDAIEELQSDSDALNGTVSNLIQQIEELSKRVPKSGVWREEESGYDDVYYECSVCGAGICTIDGDPVDNAWSYCPECGAKMTGVERLPEPPKEE